ncbi:MAG: MBL fold metallo-hydrolase, partial [Longimicrobiales bacterium]
MSVRPSSESGSPDREEVRITFWGTRGSVPSPGPHTVRYGGNTSCVGIDAGPHHLILDAGTGIRRLGRLLPAARRPLDATLLLTHLHWDHVQGLPFFEPLYDHQTRLRIVSPRQDALAPDAVLAKLMQAAFFPIPRDAIAAALRFYAIDDAVVSNTGFDISVLRARHPDHTVGYRIARGTASIVFMPDDELVGGDYTMPRDWRRRLLEFADGASVLLHDATFTESEYRHRQG